MRKFIVLAGMLCMMAVPAGAQGSLVKKGSQAVVKNVGTGATKTVPGAASAAAHQSAAVTAATARQVNAAVNHTAASTAPRAGSPNSVNNPPRVPDAQTQARALAAIKTPTREELEKRVLAKQARIEEQTLEQRKLTFNTGIGKSVLFAPVESEGKTGGFSVTVVKTQIDGQDEIFGVIASHVLPESYYTYNASLKRSFHVAVKQADGKEQLLPAEVVQIAPRSMLDISLVKFSKEAETWLVPLELAQETAQKNESFFSMGFAAGKPDMEYRTAQQLSFLSVRTDQNLKGPREGFCGSPLLDAQSRVKAIHTGTRERKNMTDTSYGTHAKFINLLIKAYHNNGQALYDLVINGHTLARLNVDEYISALYLYDSTGKRLMQKNIDDKFSESFLKQALAQNPQTAYIQLTSRKAQWQTDQDGDSILKEDRSRSDTTKRQHWYNLKTRQIESSRPDVIKM